MNNTAVFRLIGVDEDDNALFQCSYCGNIIPLENDGTDDIEPARIGNVCPECGASIILFDLD